MSTQPLQVTILVFDDVEALDLGGPYEVFTTASRMHQRQHPGAPAPFAVQCVARSLAPAATAALAREVARECAVAGTGLLLNRDIALAAELGVGVQLGSEQLAGLQARPLLAGQVVGASCHDLADLRQRLEQLLGELSAPTE